MKNRNYEFSKSYYDWVCKCLNDDNKIEELAFFKLGVDLGIRPKELIEIKFSQISFPYVKNIAMSKRIKKINDKMVFMKEYYRPKRITSDTFEAINSISIPCHQDKIFNKPLHYYVDSIRVSSGDDYFNEHTMRNLKISLLCNEMQGSEEI